MTKTYPVRFRKKAIGSSVLFFTVFGFMGGMTLWQEMVVPGALGFALAGLLSLVLLVVWHEFGRQVYEIRVTDDGTVEFVPLSEGFRQSVQMAAHEIQVIERVWDTNEDGDYVWRYKVEHAGGRIELPTFLGVEVFIGHVRTLNPAIELRGLGPGLGTWP